jgi:hypothetical protein
VDVKVAFEFTRLLEHLRVIAEGFRIPFTIFIEYVLSSVGCS